MDWDMDLENGKIIVRIPADQSPSQVVLRHSNTFSLTRRDFRWVALPTPDETGKLTCKFPLIGPVDGMCAQAIRWKGTNLDATEPGVYEAEIPEPSKGWTGAFVEVFFPSDMGL